MDWDRLRVAVRVVLEPLLALGVASLLTLLLTVPFVPTGKDVVIPLHALDPAPASEDELRDRVDELDLAERIDVVLEGGAPQLVLSRVPLTQFDLTEVLDVLEASGYARAGYTEKPVIHMEALVHKDPRVLPALLTIQAGIFLLTGLIMSRWRVLGGAPYASRNALQSLVLGLGGGLAALAGSAALSAGLAAIGLPVEEQSWVQELLADRDAMARLLPWIVLVGPLAEEVFFRGYVFRFVRQELGFPAGLILSSVLFAAIHFNVSGFLVYMVIGCCLAWVYERSKNLLAPIVGHMTVNLLVLLGPTLTSGT